MVMHVETLMRDLTNDNEQQSSNGMSGTNLLYFASAEEL